MGKINILQVQYGDAIILECRRGENKGVVVVDGGPTVCSNSFIDSVWKCQPIDLMVLTHYDNDHIGGILALIDDCLDCREEIPIKEIWANCAKYIEVADSTRTSPGQGVNLAKILANIAAHGRFAWRHDICEGYKTDMKFAYIEVVSPTEEVMKMAIKKQEVVDGAPTSATSRTNSDLQTTFEDLAGNEVKAPNLNQPSSLANAASIAFVLRCDDFSILMLGDCYPHNVVAYLRAKGYSEAIPLQVDYVKVAHHGSRNNTSNELMDIIKCNNYIISTNGGDGSTNHPDREAFAHILCHPKRDMNEKVHFYLNYPIDEIVDNGAPFVNEGEYEKYNFVVHDNITEL